MRYLFLIPILITLYSCEPGNGSETHLSKEDSVYMKNRLAEIDSSNKAWASKLNSNSAIKGYYVTDANVLYIAVDGNGADKTPMATYYCRLAKDNDRSIKEVRIVNIMSFHYGDGVASGEELGKSICE
jgi:hypothetical protein